MGKCCNTQKLASQQKYSDAENFVFHCMINGYENDTLEVCAPQQLITGLCAEFNIAGGSYSNSFYSSMWQRKISELF